MKKSAMLCLATLSIAAIDAGCNSNSGTTGVPTPPTASGAQSASGAPGGAPTTGAAGKPAGSTPSANAGGAPASTSVSGGTPIAGTSSAPTVSGASGSTAAAGDGPTVSGSAGSVASATAGTDGATPPSGKLRRAVTCDFLNQTLTVVDIDKLKDGGKKADALIGTVDLSMYAPGPLAIAVTPDGKTAVVSISGGWLKLLDTSIPAGDGTLVFVDLDALKVTGELNTGASPMGIAITKDGTHAYVGQLSDTYISYVDIAAKTFDKIQTGNSWNEELAINDTGTTGILSTGTAGDAMTFTVSDGAAAKHGQTAGLTGDAGGVTFFPGTLFAFVLQAPTMLTNLTGGYNVLDATDPTAPKVTDSKRTSGDSGQAYPVAAVASRKSVVYPSADSNTKKLVLIEMGLADGKATAMQTIPVGDGTFAYGLTSTDDGLVLIAVGVEHYIAVVDLNTAKPFIVPWEVTKTGPNAIALIP
jgi:hypothetical protein